MSVPALEMKVFRPLMSQPPSRGSAEVRIPRASEPASGSVRPKAPRARPSASGRSHRSRCASSPKRSSGSEPMVTWACQAAATDWSASPICSMAATKPTVDIPMPPHPRGRASRAGPAHPSRGGGPSGSAPRPTPPAPAERSLLPAKSRQSPTNSRSALAQGEVHASILWTDRYKARTLAPCRPTAPRTPFPSIANVEEERRHRKQRLAAAFRLFGRLGFGEGTAGHITARDPELSDHFWVNPLGMSFRQIRVKDLMLVNRPGRGGRGQTGPSTWPPSSSTRRSTPPGPTSCPPPTPIRSTARPGRSLRRPLDPLTQDACAFYGDHVVFDDYTGAVLRRSRRASASPTPSAIARRPSWPTTACSRSGGASTRRPGGSSPMERTCQVQLLAEAAGTPVPIGHAGGREDRRTDRQPPRRLGLSSSPSTTSSWPRSRTCSTSSRSPSSVGSGGTGLGAAGGPGRWPTMPMRSAGTE